MMKSSAAQAADFLRVLANEKRLMIACELVGGEKSVTEICVALEARQSTVSQQLALLRREGIVSARKDAQTVYYSLANENAQMVIDLLYRMFCSNAAEKTAATEAVTA